MAINLPEIASTYYGGTADPWPCSLTSAYLTGWGFPYDQWPQDLKDQYAYNPTGAKQLLAQAGFPTGFNTNLVVDSAVDMDLVQIVKSYFANIGVNMEIRPMLSAAFTTFVMSNHANDAFAMRTQGTLGATGNPLRQFSKFQTGASGNNAMVNDPAFNAFYTQAIAATSTEQMQKLLTDANKYVTQQHYVVSLLQPNSFCLSWPWIKGYNAQYAVISGGSGPQLLFFYESRFWIDQNLKNSMNH
jgi:peptide/nickel transport system substrate-binding protein